MTVLLLRLTGPMQSWGIQSRFCQRDTGREPSRSGVIGLLCAALGRPRDRPLDDFQHLKMAVRVDREGRCMRDYHTAQNLQGGGDKVPRETVVSERFYLADADFLVGLEGDREFLARLGACLIQPVWPLSLGRKSFVPSLPIFAGMDEGKLLDVLRSSPWTDRSPDEKPPEQIRFVVEVPHGQGEPRPDVPLSFVSRAREFAVRHVISEYHPPARGSELPRHVPQQADSRSA